MKHIAGFLSLCAVLLVLPFARAAKLPSSCGPMTAHPSVQLQASSKGLSPIPAGMARLVFVQQIGVCPHCGVVRVGLDGKWIGANRGNSWFAATVRPGEQHVCVAWNAPFVRLTNRIHLTDLNAEPGKTYYLETTALTGKYQVNRVLLSKTTRDEADFLISNSKMSKTSF
uniref:Lipoprotein n=1 Tax=Acidobacterium capsulatum TaxID=33075 RepID=A0A7V4XUF6_9BACT